MKLLLIILTTTVISSCSVILGSENLGGNFILDGHSIVLSNDKPYNGVGFPAIPEKVVCAANNSRFIIVKSLNNKKSLIFWIIDKEMTAQKLEYIEGDSLLNARYRIANVFGPLDSSQFVMLKALKNIGLDFN